MNFYNREKELEKLREIGQRSSSFSQMTIVVGRRRIGKTTLIREAFEEQVYLFVSRKSEALLCGEFVSLIENQLAIKLFGTFTSFSVLFENLMEISTTRPFTLVMDEFQEFLHINPSLYADMQNVWDRYKDRSQMNLILSGSIYSLMKKIFEDRKEPLFGRATSKIHLKPFNVLTLKEILEQVYPDFSNEDLLRFYMLTGGVAKYVEIFVDHKAFTRDQQLSLIFDEYSLFLDEGKNLLIEEFGKEYTTYFSILSLIASSKTARSEIEGVLEKNIGGFLDRLEFEYSVIRKVRPISAKEGGRVVKYELIDNFLNFWFRFIYKQRSAIEIGNYGYVREIVERDFATFSGKFLERYFHQQLALSGDYSEIGSYWERGNRNEIDIVALNQREKQLLIAEVKLNPERINLEQLRQKSSKLLAKYPRYSVQFAGLSLADL
ncbi:MAG: ATP-binding protein [Sedimenticola sp.]